MTDKTEKATPEGPLARLLSSIKFLVDPVLPVDDRRDLGRLECSYEVSYLSESNQSGTGELLDISRRGLRLRTEKALSKGRNVALKPPPNLPMKDDFAPIMAKVVWACRDTDGRFLAGLLLPPGSDDEESWIEELLTRLGYADDGQRRRHVRAEADLEGLLQLAGGPQAEVTILNLGLGGALIRAQDSYEKDSTFSLLVGPFQDLPELKLQGTVLKVTATEAEHALHSVRFGPLEKRRHELLKEYIVSLLKEPEHPPLD